MRLRLLLLPLLVLGAVPGVRAATFCVDNTADLQVALVTASSNGDSNNTIRLVQGNYSLNGSALSYFGSNLAGNLSVLGGYNAGCSVRTIKPTNTVINGNAVNGSRVSFASTTRLSLLVEGVRFTQLLPGGGSGNALNFDLKHPDSRLTFRFNQVDNVNSTGAALRVTALGRADVTNNRITLNLSPRALLVDSNDPTQGARIAYNTIADNASYGLSLYNPWYRVPTALYANILWNNPTADIEFNGLHGDAYGLSNTYAKLSTANGAIGFVAGSADNTTADPLLTASYQLGAGSPAINSGAAPHFLIPTQDLNGATRFNGSAPDRGAYETALDDVDQFTVTNTADSGAGSLRFMIDKANTLGRPARISFAIGATCGPQVILLDTALPDVSVPMIIDGYSQPGASVNTLTTGFDANLCVILAGNLVTTPSFGLRTAVGGRLDVSGLIFGNFRSQALTLSQGNAHYIHGNSFGVITPGNGTTPGSGAVPANGSNLWLAGSISGAQVGGTTKAERNLFGNASGAAGAKGTGVLVEVAHAHSFVMGNYIGTDASGINGAGNAKFGVSLSPGGQTQVLNNVIADNDDAGVRIAAALGVTSQYVLVQGNRIGQNANGASLPNGNSAVLMTAGAAFNMIGAASDESIAGGNDISANSGSWVWVDPTAGSGNLVRVNNIAPGSNMSTGSAIDLGAAGHDTNDAGDTDTGANDLQNSPIINTVVRSKPDELIVNGNLLAAIGGPRYRIDVYWNQDCLFGGYGPASQWIGSALTTLPPPDGNLSYSLTLSGITAPPTGIITATATPTDKNSNATSEVSNCVEMGPDYIFIDGFQ